MTFNKSSKTLKLILYRDLIVEGRQLARFEDELIDDVGKALKFSLSVSLRYIPSGSFAEGLLNNSDIDQCGKICTNMYVILH